MHVKPSGPALFGIAAQYASGEAVLKAARAAREAGYTKMDAYTPYMIEGLAEEIGSSDDRVPKIVFVLGMLGAAAGFALQWWVTAVDYPLNVGGRPDLSWPSFIPITFECGVLVAAFAAVFGMLGLNGLPRPHHPIFEAEGFDRASNDKFFLCIEAEDEKFEKDAAIALLKSTEAENVVEVISE